MSIDRSSPVKARRKRSHPAARFRPERSISQVRSLVRITKAGARHIPLRTDPADGGSRTGQSHYVRFADRLARYYSPVVHILAGYDAYRLAAARPWLARCVDGGGRRSHHYLPLRIGTGHSGRSGRRLGRPLSSRRDDQERRGLGKDGRDRHRRFRQDRHADAWHPGDGRSSGHLVRHAFALAAGLARESRHPLSRALVAAARARGIVRRRSMPSSRSLASASWQRGVDRP